MVGQRPMEQRGGRELIREVVIVGCISTFVVELWTGPNRDAGIGTKCGYVWFGPGTDTDYDRIAQFICVADYVFEFSSVIDNGITDVLTDVFGNFIAFGNSFVTVLFSHNGVYIYSGYVIR